MVLEERGSGKSLWIDVQDKRQERKEKRKEEEKKLGEQEKFL